MHPCIITLHVMADTTFGERVRARRTKLQLTHQELARRMDVNVSTVWRLENDRIDSPMTSTLREMSRVLGVSLEWLLYGHAKRRA